MKILVCAAAAVISLSTIRLNKRTSAHIKLK